MNPIGVQVLTNKHWCENGVGSLPVNLREICASGRSNMAFICRDLRYHYDKSCKYNPVTKSMTASVQLHLGDRNQMTRKHRPIRFRLQQLGLEAQWKHLQKLPFHL
jgi:hypothetical protein